MSRNRCRAVFTLSKSSADWVGTVEIVGFVQYHGSIQIPVDEKWIIQGQLGSDSLPVQLDARIVSGSPQAPSAASIIVRSVRFSGQEAALTCEQKQNDRERFPHCTAVRVPHHLLQHTAAQAH
jgi:hypothetical protein